MNFIDKMVEQFMKVNRRMKRWQRVVSVLSAIVVFVTTYALVLPAITLDKETAAEAKMQPLQKAKVTASRVLSMKTIAVMTILLLPTKQRTMRQPRRPSQR